jgi:O-antigen/teichoic acid export membrane protein
LTSNGQEFTEIGSSETYNNVRTIAKNSLAGAIAFVANAALTLTITIILARYLGASRFGYYILIFGISLIVKTVMDTSVGIVLVREISKDKENLNHYIRRSKPILLIFSLFLLLLMLGIIKIINPDKSLLLPIYLAAGATIFIVQNINYEAAFRAMEVMEWNAFSIIFQKGLFLLLIYLIVIRNKLGLSAIFSSLLLTYSILFFIFHFIIHRKYGGKGFEFNYAFFKEMLKESLPLSLARTLRPLIFQLDTYILASISSFQIVGIYNSAKRPLNMLNVIPGIIAIPLYPHYSRVADKSITALIDIYKKSLKIMWILSLPIAVMTTILSKRIIMLFFGEQYIPAYKPLRILIWSVIFLFLSSQYQYLFTALKKQKLFTYIITITLGVNAALNIILIPNFSYVGASYAALLSEIILYLLGFCFLWKLGAKFSPAYGLFKPALCSLAIAVIIFYIRAMPLIQLLLFCILSGIIYFALIFLLRTFNKEEIGIIKMIFSKG